MTTLTAEQNAGIERIRNWYQQGASGPFRLFGPAGTGKTTMARSIPDALGLTDVYYGTFTGKAAHVLRSKGATPVSTIHSAIYKPTTSLEARGGLRDARDELADLQAFRRGVATEGVSGDDALDARIAALEAMLPELEAATRRVAFEWNPYSDWSTAELIILDEVSMVSAKLAADIERYGVPVLVLGDPAQLPPVEGGGYYTDAPADFLLTEIHRQALESPVLELATRVRLSTDARLGLTSADRKPASIADALEADQVLCWSNARRWAMITVMRRRLGRAEGRVVPGDRVMCLTNNSSIGVFNGQQFDVLDVHDTTMGPTLTVRTDEGQERTIPAFADGFQGLEWEQTVKKSGGGMRGPRMLATFANAITVHKSQGSEWSSVYVVDETHKMMSTVARREGREAAIEQARAWAYTSITRASERVTVAGR